MSAHPPTLTGLAVADHSAVVGSAVFVPYWCRRFWLKYNLSVVERRQCRPAPPPLFFVHYEPSCAVDNAAKESWTNSLN